MTWHAAIMPDDALPLDSLVGRMLRPEPHYVSDEAFDALLSLMAADATPPPPATAEPLPLWRVLQDAYNNSPSVSLEGAMAAEIEALRDWLLPEEPQPYTPGIPEDKRWASLIWCAYNERQRIRAQLTEQARIAQGEVP